jgi:hypothetical protein
MNDSEIITERAAAKMMAQLPLDQDGRLYHLGLRTGERILSFYFLALFNRHDFD